MVFGLDPAKALLMNCAEIGPGRRPDARLGLARRRVDLSLRTRQAGRRLEKTQQAVLRRIDQWCQQYEQRIRGLGGIGFFLGGIGPDGHIGFNIRGSDHLSTTRLMATNYETQAAAATDLGGMEVSPQPAGDHHRPGHHHRQSALCGDHPGGGRGQGRRGGRRRARSPRSVLIPASALRSLPQARFYLTLGGRAISTSGRCDCSRTAGACRRAGGMGPVDLAVAREKRVLDLTEDDVPGRHRGPRGRRPRRSRSRRSRRWSTSGWCTRSKPAAAAAKHAISAHRAAPRRPDAGLLALHRPQHPRAPPTSTTSSR